MAVLGAQIVITMIMASIMSKISPYESFSRWILTGYSKLVRFVHPSDEELKSLLAPQMASKSSGSSGSARNRRKNGGGQSNANGGNDVFNVPKNIDVQLETSSVQVSDLIQLRFYAEYQWLLDFALYAIMVYTLTESYIYMFPKKADSEVNLSMVWCLLAIGFAYKILASLTGLYFEGDDGGERSLVIVMGFAYLFVSMMVLIVSEDVLESGLDQAYADFNNSAAVFLADNAGLDSQGPASKLMLKFCLALWCGSIGALFTFPGLRMARMHWDALKYTDNGPMSLLLHLTFVSPLILTALWVKPLSRDYLTERTFGGIEKPLLTSEQFETVRLYTVVLVLFFRLIMMPTYLQSYLNMAYHKLEELKQEAGKISNVELKKSVVRVFYYLCVVTLQYVCPMILILFMTFIYKTMGDSGSWMFGSPQNGTLSEEISSATERPVLKLEIEPLNVRREEMEAKIDVVTGQFSLAWQSLKHVFTPAVFRGLVGFSTWWCCLSWFTSAAIGITYQSYFAKA